MTKATAAVWNGEGFSLVQEALPELRPRKCSDFSTDLRSACIAC